MLLVNGLQLDVVPLITTLRACLFHQFSINLGCLLIQAILHQLVHEHLMGDSIKRLSEVKAGNIHCSPLIYQAISL